MIDRPVFVVGMPRSGTTLLATILGRSPELAIPHETHFFNTFDRSRGSLASRLERYLSSPFVSQFGFSDDVIEGIRGRCLKEHVVGAPLSLLTRHFAAVTGKPRWGEKTPGHIWFLKRVWTVFPEARVIHIVRDPRAVSHSLARMPFFHGNAVRCARLWSRAFRIHQEAQRRSRAYTAVRYEDLVLDSRGVVSKLADFVGIDFGPHLLEVSGSPIIFDPAAEPWKAKAIHPIDSSRLHSWREEGSHAQARLVQDMTKVGMETFGYPRLEGARSPMLYRVTETVKNELSTGVHLLRRVRRRALSDRFGRVALDLGIGSSPSARADDEG
jgi:hypothetical protein